MLSLFRRITAPAAHIAPPAAQVTSLDVTHAGATYRVALKRSATARRLTLRVRAASRDAVLTMPARGSLSAAREFAQRHGAWIGARLARLPQQIVFSPGAIIPLRGVEHVITHRPGARGRVSIEALADGQLGICVTGGEAHVARRVTDYLMRQARRDIEASVAFYTAAIKQPVRSITLRDTSSRWGSCSSQGSLNFSWRLVLAPAYVLDYLCAHEVAHLVHMNHSARFWKLTQSLCPATDRAEVWLKAHGTGLHRFG